MWPFTRKNDDVYFGEDESLRDREKEDEVEEWLNKCGVAGDFIDVVPVRWQYRFGTWLRVNRPHFFYLIVYEDHTPY